MAIAFASLAGDWTGMGARVAELNRLVAVLLPFRCCLDDASVCAC